MKKFLILFLLPLLGCARVELCPYRYELEMRPGQTHYGAMDPARIFDENNCLREDVWEVTDSERPCLDPNNTGCITRERWDAFNNHWLFHTPEPEIPLCDQMF